MTDIISHNENKEDFEDGELPEDGEICDDEEESVKAAPPSKPKEYQPPPMAAAHVAPAVEKPREPRERVRRFEQNSPPRERERERDPDPFGSHSDAPDGNEYFGDKDYRSAGAAASSEEEPFTDTDYRTNRRRRLSPSHDDAEYESRSKRPFFNGGGGRGGFRGGFRNGPKPRFQTEHQICKFFREGYCRDGDNCSYSHQAEDSLRRPVLCNFYANSYCKKGLQCLMLHGEFPCKDFHRQKCFNDNCRFSHVPLTDYTRPIIEKIIADEDARQPQQPPVYRQNPVANAAAAAAAAQVMAPRRRVLLPGGPALNSTSPPHAPVIHAPVPQASMQNQLPPPTVVVPTIQRNPVPLHQQYPVAQGGGYFNNGPSSRPEQVQGLPPPRTIEPPRPSTHMQPMSMQQQPQLIRPMNPMNSMGPQQMQHLQQPGLVVPPQVVAQPERRAPSPPVFNLEAMLNKLANSDKMRQSPKTNVIDDSPASPPAFSTNMFGSNNRVAVIPQTIQVVWGLLRIQKRLPYSNVENPDRIPMNDPRRAKAISKQFDAFSSLLSAGGRGGVSDPRLRAQKEKNEAAAREQQQTPTTTTTTSMPFSSWMPQIS
ncbi:hypothetical protein GCK72_015152 [Caenorhabditis remanei]|uniref:C3H1-type domain-containing protein n=1 Tax=Caenorhabditis remanei TaxID=31234 RepID=A0A6A5GWH1_CAERE|nr:hypothetical protein GCK72_015152 [Caenorhabditis remanei]KAF1758692.1 hypothetical protein GCK72_015152 [Caenorhabditis remanei]